MCDLVRLGHEGWLPSSTPPEGRPTPHLYVNTQGDQTMEGFGHGVEERGAIFQRMMEWILQHCEAADYYVD